jgi:kynurenine formamidase
VSVDAEGHGSPILSDAELAALFERCSNRNRWGAEDQRGTLNYVTDDVRLAALRTVTAGEVLSLGRDISTKPSSNNPRPAIHLPLYEQHKPVSALDFVGIAPHGFAVTHLDAVGHVYWKDGIYNGRRAADVVQSGGLTFGSIHAMRDGIVTRGVLLDVARAKGVRWLPDDAYVTVEDLRAAEELAGLRVAPGDAVFVHIGLEARESAFGPEDITRRAGLHALCLEWLHGRQVAMYSGDCVERMPYPSQTMPLPLHQIGLAAMGLCLLDCPRVGLLVDALERLGRSEFLVMAAPLRIPGGTGSAVNPLAIF